MKKIILVAVALVFGGATFAQTNSTTGTKPRFGLKGGLNLPKYKYVNDNNNTSDETETTTNFHLTGYADAPIGGVFSIQPGISLQGKGAKYFDNGTTQVEDNVLAIEIPVNILANLAAGPGKLFIGGGPYAGFNVSAQRKFISGNTNSTDLSIGNNSGDALKALDFGVNFLAGYQLSTGLNFSAGYGLGLTNLRPTSTSNTNVEQNNRVLSFSVGFAF
jgi:hypothetical protein